VVDRLAEVSRQYDRKRMTTQENEAHGAFSSKIDAQVKLMKI
jgi:hypothetical protein